MAIERLLYPTKEAREKLGNCGQTKLYELLAQGKIKAVQFGGRTMITHSELERFVSDLPQIHLQQDLDAASDAFCGKPARIDPAAEPISAKTHPLPAALENKKRSRA